MEGLRLLSSKWMVIDETTQKWAVWENRIGQYQKYIQNISPNKTNSRIRQIIEDEPEPYIFMNFTLTLHSTEKIQLGKISSLISVDHTLVSGDGIQRVLMPSYNTDWNQFTICPKASFQMTASDWLIFKKRHFDWLRLPSD